MVMPVSICERGFINKRRGRWRGEGVNRWQQRLIN
jgi:hypothetical protein